MIARTRWLDEESFPQMGKPTALVVDDPAGSRRTVARILERFGFVVFTAATAREVGAVVDRLGGPVDLLVTEAALPDLRGDVLVRWIRRKGFSPSVLYLSGRSRAELHGRGFRDLEAPLLEKPVRDDELARQVRGLFGL